MNKKLVVSLLAALILVSFHLAEAQQPKKVPKIGLLLGTSPSVAAANMEVFRETLRGLGYVEGQNIALEYRYAEGRYERLPDFAADLEIGRAHV